MADEKKPPVLSQEELDRLFSLKYEPPEKPYPRYVGKILDRIMIKLKTLEEYEECSDIVDLYQLYALMDKCQSLYAIAPADERYGCEITNHRKLFGSAGELDHALTKGIKRRGISPEDVPLIPIVEYKLVPTGNIEWYDATLTPKQRGNRRYRQSDLGIQKLQEQHQKYIEKRRQQNEEAKKNGKPDDV